MSKNKRYQLTQEQAETIREAQCYTMTRHAVQQMFPKNFTQLLRRFIPDRRTQ